MPVSAANPQKLILRSYLAPGDIVMLTAAVRDLHRACPGAYLTDVRTSCPALWENNPHRTTIEDFDAAARIIDCEYPLIHSSNQRPYHFLHGYTAFLAEALGERIPVTEFRGDVHLSKHERNSPFLDAADNPKQLPVWVVCAGGKYDFTIKWWHRRRYQQVVDTFREQICFVQVGEAGHYHPQLQHTVDLRGKTTLRQLVRLMHEADGVLCGVTLPMHLAPAVPLKPGQAARPAVVIAGGREPPHWEAYPTHQFLHTVGSLPCCAQGGCWRSRTLPLGDGDDKDHPDQLCLDVVDGLPACMDAITADEVCRQVERALHLQRRAAPSSHQ